LEQLRRATKHAALVVATRVTGDSLAPINAQYYTTPFGPPVLQVAGMHHAFLAEQAARNTPVQLVSRYRREAVDSSILRHTRQVARPYHPSRWSHHAPAGG